MPLSDIYRIPKSKFGTSTTPSDFSCGMGNGVVELVWENGQIKTHLQSNRSRSSPIHGTPLSVSSSTKLHKDGGNTARLKMGHAGSDFSVTVPTSESITRYDNVDPWFDCPTDDSLHPEYYSDLLPELPQIPLSELPNPSKLNLESGFSRRSIEKDASVRDSAIINFSHFAHPSTLFKPELHSPGTKEDSNLPKNRCKDRGSATSSATPVCSILNGFNSVARKEIISRTQHNQLVADVSKPVTSFTFQKSEGTSKQNAAVEEPSNQVHCMSLLEEHHNVEKSRDPVVASSSACSGNTVDGVPEDTKYDRKRKLCENEESEGQSDDVEEESIGFKKQVLSRAGSGLRRSRAAEVHNLSERRRRDRINEKMRALQELIPNCNKVDKASMLDEAIEYLKTLQLQVQIMSMGVGYYTAPMMFQPAMQPIQATQMTHFPRVGLAMGMGLGVGSFEVNGFNPACPTFHSCHTQGGHFSDPACFSRIPAQHNVHAMGLQGQGFPLSTLHASAIPLSACDPVKANVGINAFEAAGIIEANETAPTSTRNVSADAIQDPSGGLRNIHKQMGFQP